MIKSITALIANNRKREIPVRGRKPKLLKDNGINSYRKREIPVRGRKQAVQYLIFLHGCHRKREIPVRGRKLFLSLFTAYGTI